MLFYVARFEETIFEDGEKCHNQQMNSKSYQTGLNWIRNGEKKERSERNEENLLIGNFSGKTR
jgi:hypothetical protein